MIPTLDKIVSVLKAKNYPIKEDDKKNYNLNLVGIRHNSNVPNAFDDTMTVFWKFNGAWTLRTFPCTTDPGTYWLQHPENPHGTGILKEGFYKNLWKIGLHKGYEALVQANPCTVIRDTNKDNVLDFDSKTQETGIFGLNCHRANQNGKSIQVDAWSAACQVLQNREVFNPDNQNGVKVFEFDYFLTLCKKKKEIWGDFFDYALVNEKDFA